MVAYDPRKIPVAIADDDVELRLTEAGELTMAHVRLRAGTDLGPALAGLPGDLCPCPHWGYMISGRLAMRTADGEDVYHAGQVFHWPPGHAPVALEDCEYVDISPTQAFQEVIAHLTAPRRAAGSGPAAAR